MTDTTEDRTPSGDEGRDGSKLFRSEVLVTDGDLRVEVADHVVRRTAGDEHVLLRERDTRSLGPLSITRGSRRRSIGGTYSRDTHQAETFVHAPGSTITERVHGGVKVHASMESESIIGGGYARTVVGPFLCMTAMSDFMAWGGWAEVDVARIETAGAMIRASWGYAHACGARVTLTPNLVDDWVTRVEQFGTFIDNQAMVSHLGGPGSGQELAA